MVARAPRKRMYRTMQGRMVDIEKLRAANESVRAVGNMKVNARGDVIGAGGEIVTTKETVIKKYYEQPKGKVSDTPSKGRSMPAPKKIVVQPKSIEPVSAVKPIATEKPKVKTTAKKGIEEALDGLE
jgi:hypothetical protein|tara:strand:+ start:572 stop:952 length:381 start_codon:yes stop_codon:yes gene_type:complete